MRVMATTPAFREEWIVSEISDRFVRFLRSNDGERLKMRRDLLPRELKLGDILRTAIASED